MNQTNIMMMLHWWGILSHHNPLIYVLDENYNCFIDSFPHHFMGVLELALMPNDAFNSMFCDEAQTSILHKNI